MPKNPVNVTYSQLIEAEDATYPELMVSFVQGNGTAPIADVLAGKTGGGQALIGLGSSLISCIRFTGGVPVGDFVNTARITAEGTIDPGVDLGSDHCIVLWYHFQGDGDAVYSWN